MWGGRASSERVRTPLYGSAVTSRMTDPASALARPPRDPPTPFNPVGLTGDLAWSVESGNIAIYTTRGQNSQ